MAKESTCEKLCDGWQLWLWPVVIWWLVISVVVTVAVVCVGSRYGGDPEATDFYMALAGYPVMGGMLLTLWIIIRRYRRIGRQPGRILTIGFKVLLGFFILSATVFILVILPRFLRGP